jgi:hypothetical protein
MKGKEEEEERNKQISIYNTFDMLEEIVYIINII